MASSRIREIPEKVKLCTLIVVTKDDSILLGFKKRGFGVGKWDGFGGKVEAGEDVVVGATRELKEEAGIDGHNLSFRGQFYFTYDEQVKGLSGVDIRVYSCTEFSGQVCESDEMRPEWFRFDAVPYPQTWPDTIYWLPRILANQNVTLRGHYNNDALEWLGINTHPVDAYDIVRSVEELTFSDDWEATYP